MKPPKANVWTTRDPISSSSRFSCLLSLWQMMHPYHWSWQGVKKMANTLLNIYTNIEKVLLWSFVCFIMMKNRWRKEEFVVSSHFLINFYKLSVCAAFESLGYVRSLYLIVLKWGWDKLRGFVYLFVPANYYWIKSIHDNRILSKFLWFGWC